MNSSLRSLLLAAMAAALPLSLAAQASSSSTSTSSSSTKPTATSPSTAKPAGSTSSSPTYGATTASTAGSKGSASNISRLSDDVLERQFTAKNLMGKEVYDSRGKRIGEVKDVVLASNANPQLASGMKSMKKGDTAASTSTTRTDTGATRTASGSVGGVGATGSVDTTGSGLAVSGSVGSTGTTGAGSMAQHAQSMMGAMSDTAVVVSYGGFLGAGNDLLRIPISQLTYDQTNHRITVNVGEAELSSLPEWSETSRSAAE